MAGRRDTLVPLGMADLLAGHADTTPDWSSPYGERAYRQN